MIIYRTKCFGTLSDRVRKIKGDYLDKLFLEAKRKRVIDLEKNHILTEYGNTIQMNRKNKKDLLENLPTSEIKLTQEDKDKLYKKYQDIAKNNNIDIIIDETIPTSGRYNSDKFGDRVILNPLKSANLAETLIHESEHIKQNREGKRPAGLNYLNVINGKTHGQLLKNADNVFKWTDRVAREDGAMNETFKKLYLDKDIPLDYLKSRYRRDASYKLNLRAPLGDTTLGKNYADLI